MPHINKLYLFPLLTVLAGFRWKIELYAWEPSFEDRLKQLRQEDLSVLRKGAIANAINLGTSFSSPFLVNTITWPL